jgi:hypothetical protein
MSTRKRGAASVQGRNIIITCCIDEVEQHHIPQVQQAVAETNRRYQTYLAAHQAENARRAGARQSQEAALDALERKLNEKP